MAKDYHIIFVPKDTSQTRTLRVSALTLKLTVASVIVSIPLVFFAVLAAIHYQNKLISFKRDSVENVQLLEKKEDFIAKIASLEKTIETMDQSIIYLGELMDVDLQDMKFGLGPVSHEDIAMPSLDDESLKLEMSDVKDMRSEIDSWVNQNGELTVNKFNNKVATIKEDLSVINQKVDQIYKQNRDKIRFVNATPSQIPVNGWITSEFGMRQHPLYHGVKLHQGIDIASPIGTPIKAPADGYVLYAGQHSGYGNIVVMDHGYGITTVYAHASKVYVKAGEQVKRGFKIAAVGSTGASTGPHLHYEVQVDGIPANPMDFIVN